MPDHLELSRRGLLGIASLGAIGLARSSQSAEPSTDSSAAASPREYRIGVISASIKGAPQKTNGHTWHFAQGFHPTVNMDAIKKYLDPGSAQQFEENFRNPRRNFDQLPFADTRITHVYDADPTSAAMFAEAFPGVRADVPLEQMVREVDAIWLGDASGGGEDHFDLVAPGLARGLPTFCDKPIGGTVEGTRKILDFARQHNAPIMSSSLFRHQWGTEEALRLRDAAEFGPLQFVLACQAGGWSLPGWYIYGQHPVWMVMTLAGPGVESVSMYARENACHAILTYADRMPAEVWYGRPDVSEYCETTAYFSRRAYRWTPGIEGNYWYGHHYQIYRMAQTFRRMVQTNVEPVPHQEILEVTAIIHAAARSLTEKSRLVSLAEVL